MKFFNNIALGLVVSVGLASCEKYKALEYHVEKPVTFAEQEQINAYQPLKSYVDRTANPSFKLGAALSLSQYVQKGVMYRLVNSNFDEIVMGYDMKHGAVVQANGTLNLNNVKTLLETASSAGMSVYGHTLMWHANQNAIYLKGLIAPLVVTPPAFNNLLNLSALQNSTLTGWVQANAGAGISVVNEGMLTNTKAIKMISGANSSSPEALKLISPGITVEPGKNYQVIMYIKSNVPGEGRISFEGLGDNLPKSDWTGSGIKETFATDISWKKVSVLAKGTVGNSLKLHFDLGYKPNVTYYIDVNTLHVHDPAGTAPVVNIIANGDFEAGTGWGGWGGSSTRGVTAAGLGYGSNSKAFFVTNPKKESGFWVVQTSYSFGQNLIAGDSYELSFMVKGTAPGVIKPELQSVTGTPTRYKSNGFGDVNVTTDWQKVTMTTTVTGTDAAFRDRLTVSYGDYVGTVYIDDVVLKNTKAVGGTSFEVPKKAAEKEALLTNALDTWIKGMLEVSKQYVKAWDVVNEPMDDARPAELKTGVGRTGIPADHFFWQDYLGKDYALKAFQMARQYGNSTDIHFINDYNLEYDLNKCRGLIAYVAYLEGKGAKIDGIGTQMHIDATADRAKIDEMFKLLAATGKLIKVSELDMGLGGNTKTPQATAEQYAAQAEMYKYVVKKYFELIPAAQRYGITIWSPLDSPASSSWRAGEPIGLWTEGYVRKPAYTGVADGLSGK